MTQPRGSFSNRSPARWEVYTNMGRQIPGTRFIAFKVPLREGILEHVKDAPWFSPRTLMDHCTNLGLVVDLTNTARYYDPKVFRNQGIQHAKIFTEGRVVPSKEIVIQFFNIVNSFLKNNKHNDKLIGVHCTHGINRAGYMICRFMIQQLGIPPDQAIADFNSARGHVQERENYLEDLRQAPWIRDVVRTSDDYFDDDRDRKAIITSRPGSSNHTWRSPLLGESPKSLGERRGMKEEGQKPPRAHPEGPVVLGGSSRRVRGSFRGVYDSGAFAVTQKTASAQSGPRGIKDQSEGGAHHQGIVNVTANGGPGGAPHRKSTTPIQNTKWDTRRTGYGGITTGPTKGEWCRSTIPTSTSNEHPALGPTDHHHGGPRTNTNRQDHKAGPGNTAAHECTAVPVQTKNQRRRNARKRNKRQEHLQQQDPTQTSQGPLTCHQKDPDETHSALVPKTMYSAPSHQDAARRGGTPTNKVSHSGARC